MGSFCAALIVESGRGTGIESIAVMGRKIIQTTEQGSGT